MEPSHAYSTYAGTIHAYHYQVVGNFAKDNWKKIENGHPEPGRIWGPMGPKGPMGKPQNIALAWLACLLCLALAWSGLGLSCLPCLGLVQQASQANAGKN